MISAARSREPGRSVATTATRSFSSPEFVPTSRPNTAPSSLRDERRPLSSAVGTEPVLLNLEPTARAQSRSLEAV
jgi:hypothetical protein